MDAEVISHLGIYVNQDCEILAAKLQRRLAQIENMSYVQVKTLMFTYGREKNSETAKARP